MGVVRDAIEHTDSQNTLRRSAAMVHEMVEFMLGNPASFAILINMTSFDYFVYTHSVNVFVFSTFLAQRAGLPRNEIEELARGALLHDIGKARLDEAILLCKGKLTDEQWAEMRRHTLYSLELLLKRGRRAVSPSMWRGTTMRS